MSADTCGTGACETCVLGGAGSGDAVACCGGEAAGSASVEDRTVLAASGVAIALLAAVLAVTGGGVARALAGVALLTGLLLAVTGAAALRRGGSLGDRLTAAGTRGLPVATALLLVALGARGVTALLA